MTEEVQEPKEVQEDVSEEIIDDAADEPVEAVKDWSEEEEGEAKLFGWKAPDEWQGDKPPGYIDNPKDFLGRVHRSSIFKTMEDKIQKTEQQSQEAIRKLEVMSKRAIETQRQQHESRIADIEAKQRQAVEVGDLDSYDSLAKDRANLVQNAPKPDDTPPETAPEVDQYRAENDWTKDPMLWAEAAQSVNYMPNINTATPQQQIEFAEAHMKRKYPHLFVPAEPEKPKPVRQKVDGGGLAAGPSRSTDAFSKLPASAQRQFAIFVKQGTFKDTKKEREEYANEYNEA